MSKSPSPARKAPNTYHHGDLREALVEAAFVLTEKEGAEAVTFSALAKALGVSQAAPYRHFKDRDELLTALATRALRETGADFRKRLARRSGKSPLGKIGHAYLELGLSRKALYRLMYASPLLGRSSAESELYKAADANFDLILAAIDPTLDELTRRRFALKFWTSLHGIVMLAEEGILPPKIRKISVKELVDELVRDTELAIAAAGK
ncbi:TetR/AcrR family transcriptional regulator [Tepidicaulis sp. LMO-SS28]|uniref:TetR/AcrR family transcriptional regulator n=1 Tax=Tepidicaulis sp. LMO-SS28 TaxID=3447455 RepID=UPI003EE02779